MNEHILFYQIEKLKEVDPIENKKKLFFYIDATIP